MIDFSYDAWPSGEPYEWLGGRHDRPDDQLDFHCDLACGTVKKGRIGVDRYPAPGVNVIADLDRLETYAVARAPGKDAVLQHTALRLVLQGLPFPDSSIESIISNHSLEHIGDGFIALMDECYRVLKPGAPFRIVTPLFPSTSAVEDPDHRRYFMDGTLDAFCGTPDNHWAEAFSIPYTKARFECTDKDVSPPTPPELRWTPEDRREMRTTLRARK